MKVPKKLAAVLLAATSIPSFAGVASAQTAQAGPPPQATGAAYQQQVATGPQVAQQDIDSFANSIGVQTAFPLAKVGFSQGTLPNGQQVGLEFQLSGNQTAGFSVFNLADPVQSQAFQTAIDNAATTENQLQAGMSQPQIANLYPATYEVVAPVVVPRLYGFAGWYGAPVCGVGPAVGIGIGPVGIGIGTGVYCGYNVGLWAPVFLPGFPHYGGYGYGWGGMRRDVIVNINNYNGGYRGAGPRGTGYAGSFNNRAVTPTGHNYANGNIPHGFVNNAPRATGAMPRATVNAGAMPRATVNAGAMPRATGSFNAPRAAAPAAPRMAAPAAPHFSAPAAPHFSGGGGGARAGGGRR